MENIFLKLLNMSITSAWLVVAIIIARFILKKSPKRISCFLWIFVAVRLVCPFSIESIFSLIPSVQTVPDDFLYTDTPSINSGIPVLNSAVNSAISDAIISDAQSADLIGIITSAASYVWLAGTAIILIYALTSYLKIRNQVKEAVRLEENIWVCEHISAPFILGVFRPRIYMPLNINETDREYVLSHEKAHLKRLDHLWKPFGFLLLSVYWFNPLLWAGYALMCRDIELACDERVIKENGVSIKKAYSEALINCSASQKAITVCPLAFGETGVKLRIKSILNYKKPAFWVVITAVILLTVMSVCLLTNPVSQDIDVGLKAFLDAQVTEHNKTEHTQGNFVTVDYKILKSENSAKQVQMFMWVLYEEYSFDGNLKRECSSYTPAVITAENENGQYKLSEYWTPRDGEYYVADIKDKFPIFLQSKALNSQKYFDEQRERCEKSAKEHFKTYDINVLDKIEFNLLKSSFSLDDIEKNNIKGNLINNSNYDLVFGEEWKLRKDSAELPLRENHGWDSVARITKSGGSCELKLYLNTFDADFSEQGDYTLIKEFNIIKNAEKELGEMPNAKKYYIIIRFSGADEAGNITPYAKVSDALGNGCLFFNAEVLEVFEKSILVKPIGDCDEAKYYDKLEVPLNVVSKHPVPDLKAGDKICIAYSGEILEYPAKLKSVFAVYALDSSGYAVIPTPTAD